MRGVFGKPREESIEALEMALLEADVGIEATERIKNAVAMQKKEIGAVIREEVKNILNENTLDFDEFVKTHEKPVKLLFVGINGSGKTTTIAKVGYRLKNNGYSCVFGSCDTFRAGAVEQLKYHGEKLGIEVIAHDYGSDPASVAFDAIAHAKAKRMDAALLDTAGRMQTNKNLMEEMKKIKRVSNADLTIFVGDGLAGNDALLEAKEFDANIGIDCVILTKIDSDAKGGSAIAIAQELKKPIIFLGIGEGYDKLMKFDAEWFVKRLFEDV
ncbi:MAG: signal recognition particle-docking protein FtsY [Candidatus Thermoplasmatota archaeon]|nr:signal recognition particle-docking protein FtsY [Candidatus Thermoplasmatota archaeon]